VFLGYAVQSIVVTIARTVAMLCFDDHFPKCEDFPTEKVTINWFIAIDHLQYRESATALYSFDVFRWENFTFVSDWMPFVTFFLLKITDEFADG
jgi:hypothetical protein